jgi:hypothetical protein
MLQRGDLAFCRRAKAIGVTLIVAAGIPVEHVAPRDGTAYLPGMPVLAMDGNIMPSLSHEHLSGAGEVKSSERRKYDIEDREAANRQRDQKVEDWMNAELKQRRKIAEEAA